MFSSCSSRSTVHLLWLAGTSGSHLLRTTPTNLWSAAGFLQWEAWQETGQETEIRVFILLDPSLQLIMGQLGPSTKVHSSWWKVLSQLQVLSTPSDIHFSSCMSLEAMTSHCAYLSRLNITPWFFLNPECIFFCKQFFFLMLPNLCEPSASCWAPNWGIFQSWKCCNKYQKCQYGELEAHFWAWIEHVCLVQSFAIRQKQEKKGDFWSGFLITKIVDNWSTIGHACLDKRIVQRWYVKFSWLKLNTFDSLES